MSTTVTMQCWRCVQFYVYWTKHNKTPIKFLLCAVMWVLMFITEPLFSTYVMQIWVANLIKLLPFFQCAGYFDMCCILPLLLCILQELQTNLDSQG